MNQRITISIPLEQQKWQTPADITYIRGMLNEINGHYLVHKPAAYYPDTKRAIDVTISGLILLVVTPVLFPVLALLVKLTSKGPVFFKQKRTGYKGKSFDCYKFRTMLVNDEADTKQATTGDARITRIGKFLRFTHLDELPQFYNVLKGDMSIVGPRPHMLYHTGYYTTLVPYYGLRHNVRPGITGMAQIKGYVGEINDVRDLRKRVQWDLYYLKNSSALLDIKIVFITATHVFFRIFRPFSPTRRY